MAAKWKDANREVSDVCRDAAEEIRVLRTEMKYLQNTKEPYKTSYNDYRSMGWGKGKDE